MEGKSFSKLSSKYKTFLSKLEDEEVFKYFDEDMHFSDVIKLHNTITEILLSSDMQISDINHIMNNYKRDDNYIVNKIKKFGSYHNYSLIKTALKSSSWEKIKNKISKDFDCNDDIAKKVLIKLFGQYVGTWNTLYKIITLNKSGKVKSIIIDDPEDIEFMANIIKINY